MHQKELPYLSSPIAADERFNAIRYITHARPESSVWRHPALYWGLHPGQTNDMIHFLVHYCEKLRGKANPTCDWAHGAPDDSVNELLGEWNSRWGEAHKQVELARFAESADPGAETSKSGEDLDLEDSRNKSDVNYSAPAAARASSYEHVAPVTSVTPDDLDDDMGMFDIGD